MLLHSTSLAFVLSCLLAAMIHPARADGGDCNGVGPLADGGDMTLGRIGAGTPRTNFVKNDSESKGCPNASGACRSRAFLVPGDQLIVSGMRGAFVCADYVNAKGAERVGWLPAAAVTREATKPTSLTDWTGAWIREEAEVRIKPSRRAGELAIHGDATLGALDPDRVKRGNVNVGEINGTLAPKGSALAFTMGEKATLPVETGDASDCKVWMRRLGPYLLVDDNNNCGGFNVSFRGTYQRKR